jgi:hypothetical protein
MGVNGRWNILIIPPIGINSNNKKTYEINRSNLSNRHAGGLAVVGCKQNGSDSSTSDAPTNASMSHDNGMMNETTNMMATNSLSETNRLSDMDTNMPMTNNMPDMNTNISDSTNQ